MKTTKLKNIIEQFVSAHSNKLTTEEKKEIEQIQKQLETELTVAQMATILYRLLRIFVISKFIIEHFDI